MNWFKNENGFVYLDLDFVQTKNTPRNPYVGGYGRKIPTSFKVLHDGRFYRVYCAQFSNTGSCYIMTNSRYVLVNLRNEITNERLRN